MIKDDYSLQEYCREMAIDIARETMEEKQDENQLVDRVFEHADNCEHVIYYDRAKKICCHCNTDMGEEWFNDSGEFKPGINFDKICVKIAFGEIYYRILDFAGQEFERLQREHEG